MRILIVDDVPAMRHFLELMLHEFKATAIDQAEDGLRAVQLFRQQRYDLVLLDLNLPLMDGLKVLGAIRQSEPRDRPTHVIIISTQAGPDAVEKAQRLGVRHVLSKPLKAATLHGAIREELGMPSPSRPGSERRGGERLRIPAVVLIEGEWQAINARTWDISATGAFISTEEVRPVGTRATLKLEFPHLQLPLTVECRIIHVREQPVGDMPQGIGVQFVHSDPEAERRFLAIFVSP